MQYLGCVVWTVLEKEIETEWNKQRERVEEEERETFELENLSWVISNFVTLFGSLNLFFISPSKNN